jgi:hypothetical protein
MFSRAGATQQGFCGRTGRKARFYRRNRAPSPVIKKSPAEISAVCLANFYRAEQNTAELGSGDEISDSLRAC